MSVPANAADLPGTRRWLRRYWLLAIPLAVSWFAVWGLLLQPFEYMPSRSAPHFQPHVRYLATQTAGTAGGAQSDLRVMWSPVLFALPTPMGFSRASAAGEGRDHPRIQRPVIEPVLLQPAPVGTGLPVVQVPTRPPFLDGVNFRLDGIAPVFPAVQASSNTLAFEFLDGLAGGRALDTPLPALPADLVADAWSIVAHLDVGREGGVRDVFLEVPTSSPEFNAAVAQALYHWRFAPASTAVSGVIHLHHAVRPVPAAHVNGVGRP